MPRKMTSEHATEVIEPIAAVFPEDSPIKRLMDSGIIVAAEGAISWREGHVMHVARCYVDNPAHCIRNYGDDLSVLEGSSDWSAALEQAKAERDAAS